MFQIMNKKSVIALSVLLLSSYLAASQFIMMGAVVMPISEGEMAFGDYDNDGDLDIITVGSHNNNGSPSRQARLYRNDGNWNFTLMPFVFGNYIKGSVAWGDFDNDGWLDLILTGKESPTLTDPTRLFRNNQGQGFTEVPTSISDYTYARLVWADVDNDFNRDLVAIGVPTATGIYGDLCIYYNLGNGMFLYDGLGDLPNYIASPGYLRLDDFNRDGYLDLSISGSRVNGGIYNPGTEVWTRDAEGNYENLAGVGVGLRGGLAWFDYDNDGDLDLVYCGESMNGDVTVLLLNDMSTYVNTPHSFPNLSQGDVCAVDFDNDGDDDLFISGAIGVNSLCHIYRNEGDGEFVEINMGIQPVSYGYTYWVDLDNDGDVDLAYFGEDFSNHTMFYRNDTVNVNLPPTPPNLSYDPISGFTIWGASDSVTLTENLTYDLKIGTSPGGTDVYHPHADPNSGFRRVPGHGRPNFSKHFLPEGSIYYASAQAIDGAFMGSAWGPEICINLSLTNLDMEQVSSLNVYPNPFYNNLSIKFESSLVGLISTRIYNLKGQLVKRLEQIDHKGGISVLEWKGNDDNGLQVGSGLYVIRMEVAGKFTTKRVLLYR